MTENEIKILDHLHSRYPDPDATNIEMSRHLKIDKADFYAAIKRLTDKEYIKETTTINQKEGKLQSWEITLDGAIHFHRLNYQTRIDKLEHRQVRMAIDCSGQTSGSPLAQSSLACII
jgi:Winged helix-turn-helix DNA-binding